MPSTRGPSSCSHRRSSLPCILSALFAVFIIYGTVIPFNLASSREQVLTNLSEIIWTPFIDPDGSRASIPDVIQNILLFIPFGFFGFFALRPNTTSSLTSLLLRMFLTGGLGFALSMTVEILQIFTVDRVTSVTDLLTNTLGTVIGCIGAHILAESLDRLIRSPIVQKASCSYTFYPLILSFIIVATGALQPFDFGLDVGRIGSRVLRILRNPFDFTLIIRDEPFLFFRFFLFGYVCTLWFKENEQSRAASKGAVLSSVTAVFLEGSQIFTKSHIPGLQDTLVMVLGSVSGAFCIPSITRRASIKQLCFLMTGAILFTSGIQVLSPFRFKSIYQSINWIPFLPYYDRNFITALGMFVEGMLIYFPLGFVLRLLLSNSSTVFSIIGLIGLGIASALEFAQGWVVGRHPDITDILGAFIGTVVGVWCAGTGWEAFSRAATEKMIQRAHVCNESGSNKRVGN